MFEKNNYKIMLFLAVIAGVISQFVPPLELSELKKVKDIVEKNMDKDGATGSFITIKNSLGDSIRLNVPAGTKEQNMSVRQIKVGTTISAWYDDSIELRGGFSVWQIKQDQSVILPYSQVLKSSLAAYRFLYGSAILLFLASIILLFFGKKEHSKGGTI